MVTFQLKRLQWIVIKIIISVPEMKERELFSKYKVMNAEDGSVWKALYIH